MPFPLVSDEPSCRMLPAHVALVGNRRAHFEHDGSPMCSILAPPTEPARSARTCGFPIRRLTSSGPGSKIDIVLPAPPARLGEEASQWHRTAEGVAARTTAA